MTNPKTFLAEIGPFVGLGYPTHNFSHEDVPLEMFPPVGLLAGVPQSMGGARLEQQTEVPLVFLKQLHEAPPVSVCSGAFPSAGATFSEAVGTKLPAGWNGKLENAQSASNFSPGYAPSSCWGRPGSEIS